MGYGTPSPTMTVEKHYLSWLNILEKNKIICVFILEFSVNLHNFPITYV